MWGTKTIVFYYITYVHYGIQSEGTNKYVRCRLEPKLYKHYYEDDMELYFLTVSAVSTEAQVIIAHRTNDKRS